MTRTQTGTYPADTTGISKLLAHVGARLAQLTTNPGPGGQTRISARTHPSLALATLMKDCSFTAASVQVDEGPFPLRAVKLVFGIRDGFRHRTAILNLTLLIETGRRTSTAFQAFAAV
jgi:hypothetical protein